MQSFQIFQPHVWKEWDSSWGDALHGALEHKKSPVKIQHISIQSRQSWSVHEMLLSQGRDWGDTSYFTAPPVPGFKKRKERMEWKMKDGGKK